MLLDDSRGASRVVGSSHSRVEDPFRSIGHAKEQNTDGAGWRGALMKGIAACHATGQMFVAGQRAEHLTAFGGMPSLRKEPP